MVFSALSSWFCRASGWRSARVSTVVVVVGLCQVAVPAAAQSPVGDPCLGHHRDLAPYQAVLEAAVVDRVAPGMAAAVVADGTICLLVRAGRETWAPDAPPVDPRRTRFDLASLTKVLGPVALAGVSVDHGVISWGGPFRAFPERPDAGASLTLARLLAHQAGVAALPPWPQRVVRKRRGRVTRRPAIPGDASARWRVVLQTPQRQAAGAEYTDVGPNLVWVGLGRLWGQAPERVVAQRVWGPLGMRRVTFAPDRRDPMWGLAASTHDGRVHDPLARLLASPAGHAGIFATVEDVARFVAELTNPAPQVFSPETQAALLGSFTPDGAFGLVPCSWQHGCGAHFSAQARGHTGYTGTSLWIDRGVGVVLLANRAYQPMHRDSFRRLYAVRQALADLAVPSVAFGTVPPVP